MKSTLSIINGEIIVKYGPHCCKNALSSTYLFTAGAFTGGGSVLEGLWSRFCHIPCQEMHFLHIFLLLQLYVVANGFGDLLRKLDAAILQIWSHKWHWPQPHIILVMSNGSGISFNFFDTYCTVILKSMSFICVLSGKVMDCYSLGAGCGGPWDYCGILLLECLWIVQAAHVIVAMIELVNVSVWQVTHTRYSSLPNEGLG